MSRRRSLSRKSIVEDKHLEAVRARVQEESHLADLDEKVKKLVKDIKSKEIEWRLNENKAFGVNNETENSPINPNALQFKDLVDVKSYAKARKLLKQLKDLRQEADGMLQEQMEMIEKAISVIQLENDTVNQCVQETVGDSNLLQVMKQNLDVHKSYENEKKNIQDKKMQLIGYKDDIDSLEKQISQENRLVEKEFPEIAELLQSYDPNQDGIRVSKDNILDCLQKLKQYEDNEDVKDILDQVISSWNNRLDLIRKADEFRILREEEEKKSKKLAINRLGSEFNSIKKDEFLLPSLMNFTQVSSSPNGSTNDILNELDQVHPNRTVDGVNIEPKPTKYGSSVNSISAGNDLDFQKVAVANKSLQQESQSIDKTNEHAANQLQTLKEYSQENKKLKSCLQCIHIMREYHDLAPQLEDIQTLLNSIEDLHRILPPKNEELKKKFEEIDHENKDTNHSVDKNTKTLPKLRCGKVYMEGEDYKELKTIIDESSEAIAKSLEEYKLKAQESQEMETKRKDLYTSFHPSTPEHKKKEETPSSPPRFAFLSPNQKSRSLRSLAESESENEEMAETQAHIFALDQAFSDYIQMIEQEYVSKEKEEEVTGNNHSNREVYSPNDHQRVTSTLVETMSICKEIVQDQEEVILPLAQTSKEEKETLEAQEKLLCEIVDHLIKLKEASIALEAYVVEQKKQESLYKTNLGSILLNGMGSSSSDEKDDLFASLRTKHAHKIHKPEATIESSSSSSKKHWNKLRAAVLPFKWATHRQTVRLENAPMANFSLSEVLTSKVHDNLMTLEFNEKTRADIASILERSKKVFPVQRTTGSYALVFMPFRGTKTQYNSAPISPNPQKKITSPFFNSPDSVPAETSKIGITAGSLRRTSSTVIETGMVSKLKRTHTMLLTRDANKDNLYANANSVNTNDFYGSTASSNRRLDDLDLAISPRATKPKDNNQSSMSFFTTNNYKDEPSEIEVEVEKYQDTIQQCKDTIRELYEEERKISTEVVEKTNITIKKLSVLNTQILQEKAIYEPQTLTKIFEKLKYPEFKE